MSKLGQFGLNMLPSSHTTPQFNKNDRVLVTGSVGLVKSLNWKQIDEKPQIVDITNFPGRIHEITTSPGGWIIYTIKFDNNYYGVEVNSNEHTIHKQIQQRNGEGPPMLNVRSQPPRSHQSAQSQASAAPAFGQPGQAYVQPGQGYAQTGPVYVQPGQAYVQPGQGYAQTGQAYAQPGQAYAQPGQAYAQPGQAYAQPGQAYAQPGQAYAQPGQGHAQTGPIPPDIFQIMLNTYS